MNPKTLIGLMGVAYGGVEKMLAVLFISGVFFYTSLPADGAALALHGDWADRALSEVLSDKYGRAVTVKDARIAGWSGVSFGSLDIRTAEGRRLIHSSRGSLRLKKWDLSGKTPFETELRLQRVIFFHEYYKDSPTFRPWNRVLRKPFRVEELVLRILQNREKTRVNILKSASRDLILDGGIVVDRSGHWQDDLRVSFSPWMMLRALI